MIFSDFSVFRKISDGQRIQDVLYQSFILVPYGGKVDILISFKHHIKIGEQGLSLLLTEFFF